MIKRFKRNVMKALCIFVLFTASATVAHAYAGTVAYSIWTTHTSMLKRVQSQAIVQSHTRLNGFTTVKTPDGSNFETGYLGARALIFDYGGTLIGLSDWLYSTSPTNEWTVGTSSNPSSGDYYSEGMIRVFNGSSYVTGGTARTPSVNY